jgi:hypothetical protein
MDKIWPEFGQLKSCETGRSKTWQGIGWSKSWLDGRRLFGQKYGWRLVGKKHGQNMARVWSGKIMA